MLDPDEAFSVDVSGERIGVYDCVVHAFTVAHDAVIRTHSEAVVRRVSDGERMGGVRPANDAWLFHYLRNESMSDPEQFIRERSWAHHDVA